MSNYTLYESSPDWTQPDRTAYVNAEGRINNGTVKQGGNVAANGPANAVNVVTTYDKNYGGVYVAGVNNAVGAGAWELSTGNSSIANGTGLWAGHEVVTDTSHGLVVGDVVRLEGNKTGAYRVVAVINANSYVINSKYSAVIASGVNVYHGALNVAGTAITPVGNLRAGYYATRMVPLQINNGTTVINVMSSPSSSYTRRKVNSRASVRSKLVEAAIRAGYWNPYTGTFSTPPTAQNDFSSFGADQEVADSATSFGTKGEFSYRYGITVTQDDY